MVSTPQRLLWVTHLRSKWEVTRSPLAQHPWWDIEHVTAINGPVREKHGGHGAAAVQGNSTAYRDHVAGLAALAGVP